MDVVVVGAGLAGLCSAAYLVRDGLNVTLCERGSKTGGLVSSFWHEGFTFDAGIRAFENSGIIFPMLDDLGVNIDFVHNPVAIGIEDKMVELEGPQSLETYATMLKELFPENSLEVDKIIEEIRKVMGYMDVLYGIDNPLFVKDKDLKYLTKTLLPWFIKYQRNIKKATKLNEDVETYLLRFTSNQALVDMIIQHFFKKTPTFFALSYFSLYLEYNYPIGGTGVLAEKMSDFILSKGGEILTNTSVVEVDAQNHFAKLSTNEIIEYDQLIWAADQKSLYELTKGIDSNQYNHQRSVLKNSKGNDSILTIFLGIDKPLEYFKETCGDHLFYTPSTKGLSSLEDWKKHDSDINNLYQWIEHYLELTTYEISCPGLRDPKLAPDGQAGLIVSTLMDYELVNHFKELGAYDQFKELCSQKILSVLDESLFNDLSEHLLFSMCSTPLTIEKLTNNFEGAITGWSFTNPVMPSISEFKKITEAINTAIPDLYQCGQWTFSPSGLPVSVLTGKVAADQVLKVRKNEK